jgi:hypothetical protein
LPSSAGSTMQPRGVDTPLFLQSRIAMRNIPLTNRLLAVNTIVKNRNGEVSSCDIPYSRNLSEFNHNYLKLTKQVSLDCSYGFDFGLSGDRLWIYRIIYDG